MPEPKSSIEQISIVINPLEKGDDSSISGNHKVTSQSVSNDLTPMIVFPWLAKLSIGVLLVLFLSISFGYFYVLITNEQPIWFNLAMLVAWLVAIVGGVILLLWLWYEYFHFCKNLFDWINTFRQGDLSMRLPTFKQTGPSCLVREHLNSFADDYQNLSNRFEQRIQKQEKCIKQNKFYLNSLYEVVSSINQAQTLDELLIRFLNTMKEVLDPQAASIRLQNKSGQLKLVASVGLSDLIVSLDENIPSPNCICSHSFEKGTITFNTNIKLCSQRIGHSFLEKEDVDVVAIPIQYRRKTLGIYTLFFSHQRSSEEEYELLMSIGQHLGMAIEKAGVDEEARLLSIVEERTRMAHELHDSLAQTLASLRFKVRLVDDSLNNGDESAVWSELDDLEGYIEEANAELRSLIIHFRSPIDGKGIIRAVERITDRFRRETSIEVFFYHNWSLEAVDKNVEYEAIRIVQEALANVRKHSQAETVRILMYSSEDGHCRILVEDDGIGMPEKPSKPNRQTGEHFGLTTMKERAEQINGEIVFESDPDEGTLVQLSFVVDIS